MEADDDRQDEDRHDDADEDASGQARDDHAQEGRPFRGDKFAKKSMAYFMGWWTHSQNHPISF
jgi:hypothetical protein